MIGVSRKSTPRDLDPRIWYEPTLQGGFNAPTTANYAENGSPFAILNVSNVTNTTFDYWRVGNFNGTTNLCAIGSMSTQNAIVAGDFTWFFSFRLVDATPSSPNALLGTFVNGQSIFYVSVETSGFIRFRMTKLNAPTYEAIVITDNQELSDNTWHRLTITRTGDTVVFYVDGNSVATTTTGGSNISTFLTNVGFQNTAGLMNRNSSPQLRSNGDLMSHLWFDRVLTQFEIDFLETYYKV